MNRNNRILQYLVAGIILAAVIALLTAMGYSSWIKNSYHWTKSSSQAAAPQITEDYIRSLLARVADPELGVNIVDLGLVYGVRLPLPGSVDITMTMTTPYCPFNRNIVDDIQKTLMSETAINEVRLRIVFEPAWSWSRVDKRVRDRIINLFSAVPGNEGKSND